MRQQLAADDPRTNEALSKSGYFILSSLPFSIEIRICREFESAVNWSGCGPVFEFPALHRAILKYFMASPAVYRYVESVESFPCHTDG